MSGKINEDKKFVRRLPIKFRSSGLLFCLIHIQHNRSTTYITNNHVRLQSYHTVFNPYLELDSQKDAGKCDFIHFASNVATAVGVSNWHTRTPALRKASSFLQIRCGNFQNGLFRP